MSCHDQVWQKKVFQVELWMAHLWHNSQMTPRRLNVNEISKLLLNIKICCLTFLMLFYDFQTKMLSKKLFQSFTETFPVYKSLNSILNVCLFTLHKFHWFIYAKCHLTRVRGLVLQKLFCKTRKSTSLPWKLLPLIKLLLPTYLRKIKINKTTGLRLRAECKTQWNMRTVSTHHINLIWVDAMIRNGIKSLSKCNHRIAFVFFIPELSFLLLFLIKHKSAL